jgi:hypothetical protein
VSDLWIPNTQSWNLDLLNNIFDHQGVSIISQVQPVHREQQDILRWIPTKKGDFTTKNVYRHFRAQMQVQLPQQGSRSILPQANQILHRMWKLKEISPLIKTFTWRLIRRALATGQRAGRYSTNIDKLCTACGKLENDAHLFFHCDFARAVWFSADPPLCTDTLPQEEDRVQSILTTFISDSTPNFLLQKILVTLWYLWKARNDQRFQRKTWTLWQLHHAVAGYIATLNAALHAVEQQLTCS